jgi:hypothetical protein
MIDSFVQNALEGWETDGGASAAARCLSMPRARQASAARETSGTRLAQPFGLDAEIDAAWRGEVIAVRSLVSDRAWRSFRIMREPRRQN